MGVMILTSAVAVVLIAFVALDAAGLLTNRNRNDD